MSNKVPHLIFEQQWLAYAAQKRTVWCNQLLCHWAGAGTIKHYWRIMKVDNPQTESLNLEGYWVMPKDFKFCHWQVTQHVIWAGVGLGNKCTLFTKETLIGS